VVLQGIQQHFDALEIALFQHLALKKFEMTDCISAIPDVYQES
jgi:hypothetical protein